MAYTFTTMCPGCHTIKRIQVENVESHLEERTCGHCKAQKDPEMVWALRVLIEFVKGWLREQKYKQQPDHDGSNSKGFVVTNGGMRDRGVILSVQPCWAMHGK